MLEKNVTLSGKTILVTGAAGFIGANLVMELLRSEHKVQIVGLDNLNDYYDVSLKEFRLKEIQSLHEKSTGSFTFIKGDLADKALIDEIFQNGRDTGIPAQDFELPF